MNRMELESFWLLSFRFGFEFSTKLDQPGLSSSIRLEVMRVYPEMVYAIIVKLVILLFFLFRSTKRRVALIGSEETKSVFFFHPSSQRFKGFCLAAAYSQDSALQHIHKYLLSRNYPAALSALFFPCSHYPCSPSQLSRFFQAFTFQAISSYLAPSLLSLSLSACL